MAKKNLKNMSDADLEVYNNELFEKRRELKAQQMLVQEEMNRRHALAKIDALTDKEKVELAQVLAAEGIGSDEAFGTPG